MKSKLDWICINYPKNNFCIEEQVKDLCVEMWNEMAENEYRDKEDSKLIDIFNLDCGCFACEYYRSSCSECQFDILFGGCTTSNSPFENGATL